MSDRPKMPPMEVRPCGCQYSHYYDPGGFGEGSPHWIVESNPEIPCDSHKKKEFERRAAEAEKKSSLRRGKQTD